jgi:hypothetical protein
VGPRSLLFARQQFVEDACDEFHNRASDKSGPNQLAVSLQAIPISRTGPEGQP